MLISVFLEIFKRGEYINIVDLIELKLLFYDLSKNKNFDLISKYNYNSLKNAKIIFNKNTKSQISYIIKDKNIYKIVFFRGDIHKNFIINFFLNLKTHKLYIKKINNDFKIIKI